MKNKYFSFIILLIASIFVCIPLLNQKLDISYDDGIQHIARLMGTYQSLQEGQSFPVIMSNFCNGFGYSWNIFYSPFTAFAPLIFKLIGASFVNCIKIFMFIVVFTSGITAYLFAKEVTKNKKIALLTGIFYIFAPYRFTDMYTRNALAEFTSFVFLPMVFHGIYGILKNKPKSEYFLIVGGIGLILTHTVITMYVAILCFIYVVTQAKKLRNINIIKKLIFSLLLIIVITSFFWVPLLEHKLKAEYEVFKPGRMERTDVLIAFKLDFLDLIRTPKENIMTYEIGWISIIMLVLSPIVIKKFKVKYRNTDFFRLYMFSLIAGILLEIMTLKVFPFEHLPAILKMLQFSFRLLEFSSFFFAFVAAVNFYELIRVLHKHFMFGNYLPAKEISYRIKKFGKKSVSHKTNAVNNEDIIVILIILMILSCTFIPHLQYTDNLEEERLWPTVPVTSSTGRVHAGCASFEYLPSKAFENRSYIENRTSGLITLEGNAEIEDEQKQGSKLECQINSAEEGTIIELPYIYYLGYNVTLEQNGEIVELEEFETENGFLGVKLPVVQNASIKVNYTGTVIMKITRIISILGTIFFLFSIIIVNREAQFLKLLD